MIYNYEDALANYDVEINGVKIKYLTSKQFNEVVGKWNYAVITATIRNIVYRIIHFGDAAFVELTYKFYPNTKLFRELFDKGEIVGDFWRVRVI